MRGLEESPAPSDAREAMGLKTAKEYGDFSTLHTAIWPARCGVLLKLALGHSSFCSTAAFSRSCCSKGVMGRRRKPSTRSLAQLSQMEAPYADYGTIASTTVSAALLFWLV